MLQFRKIPIWCPLKIKMQCFLRGWKRRKGSLNWQICTTDRGEGVGGGGQLFMMTFAVLEVFEFMVKRGLSLANTFIEYPDEKRTSEN